MISARLDGYYTPWSFDNSVLLIFTSFRMCLGKGKAPHFRYYGSNPPPPPPPPPPTPPTAFLEVETNYKKNIQ